MPCLPQLAYFNVHGHDVACCLDFGLGAEAGRGAGREKSVSGEKARKSHLEIKICGLSFHIKPKRFA